MRRTENKKKNAAFVFVYRDIFSKKKKNEIPISYFMYKIHVFKKKNKSRFSRMYSNVYVCISSITDKSFRRALVENNKNSQVRQSGPAHGRADRFDGRLDAGQQLRQVTRGRRHFLLFGQHEPGERHAVRVERRWLVLLLRRRHVFRAPAASKWWLLKSRYDIGSCTA